jgi:hypothetical protein
MLPKPPSPLTSPKGPGEVPGTGIRVTRALSQSAHTGPPHSGQGWLAIGASWASISRSARHWSHSPCSGGVEMNAAPQRTHDQEILTDSWFGSPSWGQWSKGGVAPGRGGLRGSPFNSPDRDGVGLVGRPTWGAFMIGLIAVR